MECPLHFWHYNIKTGELLDYLKGVKLQKYKEGNLKSVLSFSYEKGLNIIDKNGKSRHFDDIENWLGKRGQAGKKVPKGFPRNF